MRIPTLPPHIGWPLLVVSFLSISITASVYTLFAAQGDGGPEVIADYYKKGANWNETAAARAAGQALRVDVEVRPPGPEAPLRPVVLTVRDTSGAPVIDLQGTVRLFRPQTAGAKATVPLVHVGDGVYRQAMPMADAGLWDVELKGTRDGQPVEKTVRLQFSPSP